MFDKVKKFWKGIMHMFGYTTWKSVLGTDITLTDDMITAINDWKDMLAGNAPWITDYVRSLKIESGICREFADAALVELETTLSNAKLNEIYQKCIIGLNENLQEALGLGSFVIKPISENAAEFVTADKFVPIRFSDDGKLLDIAFVTVKRVGVTDYYTKLERHYFTNGSLTIENKCYHSQSKDYIGSPCDIGQVDEWQKIDPGPVTYLGMNQMDFGYYRNPVKNNIDGSRCGVSMFDCARELIEKVDIQGARLDWEYESGERAIHVDSRALNKGGRGRNGMAQLNRRLYRGLEIEDGKDKELLKEYSPDMRDESFNRGLEKWLRRIEFSVGLSYGDLSNVQDIEKTAAEIKASKIRKYNRVDAIQKNLAVCLEDFATGLAFWNGQLHSGYEFSCKFSDSILTDEETERQQDRQDVSMGAMSLKEYRMKWYNEDEATAEKNIPEQNTVQG